MRQWNQQQRSNYQAQAALPPQKPLIHMETMEIHAHAQFIVLPACVDILLALLRGRFSLWTDLCGEAEVADIHGVPGAAGPVSVPAWPNFHPSLLRHWSGAEGHRRRLHDR